MSDRKKLVDCVDGAEHNWQPVSFVFESQLLDPEGRVRIRQPDTEEGRVYVVCMACHSHSYIVTNWVGYWLPWPGFYNEPDLPVAASLVEDGGSQSAANDHQISSRGDGER